jgi:DNA repair protein SbcD/Mre11
MAFEALRFIHAAGVLIDHQLRDVARVSPGMRSTLLDATTTSFERIIEACIEHEVDFLLLAGDTFDERDRSLRARVVLREGLQCLQEAGIQVFAIPGTADPAAAWQSISDLPDNVTVFSPEIDEPTAIMRDGNVIATLQGCLENAQSAVGASESERGEIGQSRIAPFRIGIVPQSASKTAPAGSVIDRWLAKFRIDYLAIPRPSRRLWARGPERLAHCPGSATAMTREDVGPQGCTLFKIEDRNQASQQHIVTSPIRRECPEIELEESDTWDELIDVMRRTVEAFDSLDQVSVLVIDWQLSGTGPLLDALSDPESETELFELLGMDGSLGKIENVTQGVVRVAAAIPASVSKSKNPFLGGFLGRLDHCPSVVRSVVNRISASHGEAGSHWPERLEELASRVSNDAVAASARQFGVELFGELCDDVPEDEFDDDELVGEVETEVETEAEVQDEQDDDFEADIADEDPNDVDLEGEAQPSSPSGATRARSIPKQLVRDEDDDDEFGAGAFDNYDDEQTQSENAA